MTTDNVSLLYRTEGGGFTEVAMTSVDGGKYSGTLPPGTCGWDVEFYVQAISDSGLVAGYPPFAPTEWVSVPLGRRLIESQDDLENETGWTVGDVDDNASTGIWERVDPNGTGAQPEEDHTPDPGIMCYVTGQGTPGGGIGANDVDGGKTTLFSPVFAVPLNATEVSYARWYSNNQGSSPGSDEMEVFVSNNGGGNWVLVETVSENAGAWVVHGFLPGELGVVPTDQMQLKFVASDYGGGSIVEAGIDDLTVSRLTCDPPNGDYDVSGTVDLDDYAALHACLEGPTATSVGSGCGVFNFDGDADVDMDDVLLFLTLFGAP